MNAYTLATDLAASSNGAGYESTSGPGPDFPRTCHLRGTAFVSGTFDGATLTLQVRQAAGSGSWVDLPGPVTTVGLINVDIFAGEIRASTKASGGGSTAIDVVFATDNLMGPTA
jgi:hypothetical protein